MPYVTAEARRRLNNHACMEPLTLGELDYCITCLIVDYLGRTPAAFADYAGVAGVLDYVADETKRKMSDPYERRKERENGPVYPQT